MDLHSATITLGVQTSREDDRTEKPVLRCVNCWRTIAEDPIAPKFVNSR